MSRYLFTSEDLINSLKALQPYEGPLLRTERFLFHFPSDPEYFIAALASVEGFVSWKEEENTAAYLNGRAYGLFETYVTCDDGYIFALPDTFKRVTDVQEFLKERTELEVYLDPVRAANIANDSVRSVSEGFSLIIGGDLRTCFPEKLTIGDLKDAPPKLLILMDEELRGVLDELILLFRTNFEYLRTEVVDTPSDLKDCLDLIKEGCAVIGVQSAATYLAACQKRITIELVAGRHRNFMAKWNNPYYGLIHFEEGRSISGVHSTTIFRAFKAKAENCMLRARIKDA